jgi:high-affinity iron transporter
MKFHLIAIILTVFSALAHAEVKNPSMVVHLLDYLAKDYAGAVQNGKVVSQSEFNEQVEFSDTAVQSAKAIRDFSQDAAFIKDIESLNIKIKSKTDPSEVSKLARNLQGRAIELAKIEVAPLDYPRISDGKLLFANNCASCHGSNGQGDGPAGKGLDPKPANFHLTDKKMESSPFQYFNTIRLGVPGTAMPPFSQLSDKEVWALAFFVKSIGYPVVVQNEKLDLELQQIASLKDEQILSALSGSEAQKNDLLVKIRTYEPKSLGDNHFSIVARTHLDQSFRYYQDKDFPTATSEALKAYLEGIEPQEPKIKANQDGLVEKIEGQMAAYRSSLNAQTSIEETKEKYFSALATIKEIEDVTQKQEMSPQVAFSAAFAIFLREGFEAVLIIITLLGVIKAFGAKAAARWVHTGWTSALGLGVFTWFISGLLVNMSGASREVLEGSISLFAVAVLLYVGFWLHRQTEVGRWTKFVKQTVSDALEQKSLFVLCGISFMAVFREAFEVVLFLRAVWDDVGQAGHSSVGFGVASAFVLIFAFSYYAVKFSQRIPVRQLFTVSSLIMAALSVMLTGKGIHSLQEAGIVGVKSFLNLRIDLLGVYPTVQTLLGQLLILGFLFILWNWSKAAAPTVKPKEV